MADPLLDLTTTGVAIWLDDLSRARLAEGSLARLAKSCHVVGVTSNPTIFAKAITGSAHYDQQIHELAVRGVERRDGPTPDHGPGRGLGMRPAAPGV